MKYNIKIRGFTIIEVMTTIAILIAIMLAVAMFQYDVMNHNRSGEVALTNVQEVQVLMRTIAKEIRSMEPAADGSYAIAAAASTTLTFYADVDGDLNKERVRYYLATTTVYRGIVKPTGSPPTYTAAESKKLLVTGVRTSTSSPMFEYFDSMYAGTSTPMTYPLNLTSIRLVRVTLTIDTDPNKSPTVKTYTTQVGLRNLKDNL